MSGSAAQSPKGVVWVVDDSPPEPEHASPAFSPRHFTRTFGDGTTMRERLASERPPDVLVLDWVMPGLTGIEICQFLRSKEETLELPILILTALGEIPHIVQGLGA